VLDADALNIIAKNPKMMEYLPQTTILTPHVGELARLTGTSFSNRTDIVTKALELALKHNVTVIVKGAPTVTVSPDGKLFINTTGNAGMATAGSGDVLTGIVLAMITQSYPGTEASRIATYIHGLAGDIAARKFSQTAMTSADIADCLPEAWLKMTMEL
jgi:NAD(P)H-hydrate epimerase